jgi:hypothetical protein
MLSFAWRYDVLNRSKLSLSAVAFTAFFGLMVGTSHAATILPSGITSDDVAGSGWNVTPAVDVSLLNPSFVNGALVFQEKDALFASTAPLSITFTQSGSSAATSVVIETESITNITGSTWPGFEMTLINLPGSNSSFVENANAPFAPALGYSSVSISPTDLVYTGSQANLATSTWGYSGDGELVIDTDPLGIGTTFVFKELPGTGSNPNPPVPLPAAVWQGFFGLTGLALIAAAKKRFTRKAI